MVSADASSFGIGTVFAQEQFLHRNNPNNNGSLLHISLGHRPRLNRNMLRLKKRHWHNLGVSLVNTCLVRTVCHIRIETDHKPFEGYAFCLYYLTCPRERLDYCWHFVLCSLDTSVRCWCLSQDTDIFVNTVMSRLPTTEMRLAEAEQDQACKQLKVYCKSDKHKVLVALRPFFSVSSELTVKQGILMHNNRIVIPSSLQYTKTYVLARLHMEHQGITKCRNRALQSTPS